MFCCMLHFVPPVCAVHCRQLSPVVRKFQGQVKICRPASPSGSLSATPCVWVLTSVASCVTHRYFVPHNNTLKLNFLPPQLPWRCPASLQRAWPPSPSGVWWASLATGCWPLFSACWFALWGGCSGWWKPSWRSGFSDWSWLTRPPVQTPQRSDWAAWCWGASCWRCSLRALKRLAEWSTVWAAWRAGWRRSRRGKVNSDQRGWREKEFRWTKVVGILVNYRLQWWFLSFVCQAIMGNKVSGFLLTNSLFVCLQKSPNDETTLNTFIIINNCNHTQWY